MVLRLLLAMLLVLPAGLSAGQRQGCEPALAAVVTDTSPTADHQHVDGHHATHHTSDDANTTAPLAKGCGGCDLPCKLACAAVGLPLGMQQSVSLPPSASPVADRAV